ncbi:uncharacterized protein BCR38DRAFT_436855 [Pseudomassariella vexata]|uniref:Uncharacterized protein n=1 Tax=Pseudomassariella vexata TaxID=1141098 RepID=A0A1Y2DVY6_9PEZI|nr:uncharacterized protein BCR38DRAFT_436855 [Pseudomassariella vexata]ORY63441.1 hypothetical protein BCR38DRAFT_436855 [Pseudomassariella vexata]
MSAAQHELTRAKLLVSIQRLVVLCVHAMRSIQSQRECIQGSARSSTKKCTQRCAQGNYYLSAIVHDSSAQMITSPTATIC